jgi:tRNA pseudouridine55 synthase
VDGLFVIDKPAGWTSHDVVGRMRRILGTKKVGHAGTLDPMATGMLLVGANKATRLLTFYVGHDKDYDATIRLGQATVTDDAEGEVTQTADASGVTEAEIHSAVAELTGEIEQVPSAVSAIKVDGKRSYARVRSGEDVVLKARPVTVSRFVVLAIRRLDAVVDVDIAVTVSSGTYVRALARDLGSALGVGGHLTALRRTRVGGLTLADATTLEQLTELKEAGEELPATSLARAATGALAAVAISAHDARELTHGRRATSPAEALSGVDLAAVDPQGDLVAVVRRSGTALKPVIVFAQPRAE